MFHGYTESAEKIEARKQRILAGYKPAKPAKRTKRTGGKATTRK